MFLPNHKINIDTVTHTKMPMFICEYLSNIESKG